MRARAIVPALATVALALACGETPTAPVPVPDGKGPAPPAASEPTAPGTAAPAADRTLADPFVLGLLEGFQDRGFAARLDLGLRAARVSAESGDLPGARIAIAEALGILESRSRAPDGGDDVALAAMELVLRDLADSIEPKGAAR